MRRRVVDARQVVDRRDLDDVAEARLIAWAVCEGFQVRVQPRVLILLEPTRLFDQDAEEAR